MGGTGRSRAALTLAVSLIVLLSFLPRPTLSATGTPTLAVTYFQNNTSEPTYDPLGRGLAEMLITDLSIVDGLQVVERGRLNEILKELEIQSSAFVDPKTAVAVGKGVGASFVLTGSFLAIQPEMRIDARLVEVASGKVVQAQAVTGPADEFFLLEKELAASLIDGMEVSLSARDGARMGRVATEDFDAFLAWSEGLEAIDRGALDEARDALQRALDSDDRFALADSTLGALQERLRQHASRGQEIRSAAARKLIAKIDALEQAGGPYDSLQGEVATTSTTIILPGASRDILTISSRLMDLQLPEELRLGGPSGYMSINEWSLWSYFSASYYLGRTADALTYGEAFLERYPASMHSSSIRSQMNGLIDQQRRTDASRDEIPVARAKGRIWGLWIRCYTEKRTEGRLAACREMVDASHAAGLEHEEKLKDWGTVAKWMGDVQELEALLVLANERYPRSEAVSEIREYLEDARRDKKEADEALAALEGHEAFTKHHQMMYPARDLAGVAALHGEARKWFDEAIRRWPEEAKIYSAALRAANDRDDLEWAESIIARWEQGPAADHSNFPAGKKTVQGLRERRAKQEKSPVDAVALYRTAMELVMIDQKELAGDTYSELARTFPEFPDSPEPASLQSAGTFYQGLNNAAKAREVYELLIERYPESNEARVANTMLEHIPE